MMHYLYISPIGGRSGKEQLLTYGSQVAYTAGTIVSIPFGRTTKFGVVVSTAPKPAFATKEVGNPLPEILPPQLIELAQWMSQYYAQPLSIIMQTILPSGLGKKRRGKLTMPVANSRNKTQFELTNDQRVAIQSIRGSASITNVLHGVTGSGKTRVYQELATMVLQDDKSVLVLVPEISLTPQLVTEFTHIHKNVAVLHSQLSEAQRHLLWQTVQSSTEPWVMVGPRSALFSPLKKIGLIVVDECHETSFVQDSQPKYSALRVARKLAELHPDSKLVLGSATPLVADYYIAQQTKTPIIIMNQATYQLKPQVSIIDIRKRAHFGRHAIFSALLLDAINTTLASGEQTLLFYNRRGTARTALCTNCGWVATCPNCHLPMRLHHDLEELRCHTCDRKMTLPHICPECRQPTLDFKGIGSKRIEHEIQKLFPNSTIARFDSDTPPTEQLHQRYQDLYDGTIDIIIGTQGIAKGLDLPHLDTVGIIQADSELMLPDFSSHERAFQLITQVIGRSGRAGQKSNVIVQTLNPDHPILVQATQQDYSAFYQTEIKEREAVHLPPFSFLLQLSIGYASNATAQKNCQKLADEVKQNHPGVSVRTIAPAFHERRGDAYFWQVVLSSSSRQKLVAIVNELPTRWQFTLDPLNLL